MRTTVIAVGGGAGNALNHLIRNGGIPADLVAANTDAQDLKRALAPTRLLLGTKLTKGLGAGGDAEVGRDATEADRSAIAEAVAGAQLVIVIAGLGGGTGSGGAPVVCRIAEAAGALTLAIVTRPFPFEGRRRVRVADEALTLLRALNPGRVLVPETPIPTAGEPQLTMRELFALADEAVALAVRDAIARSGLAPDLEAR